MTKITLSIADRINLQQILPSKGPYIKMVLTRQMQKEISFTPEEIRDYHINDGPDNSVTWSKSGEKYYLDLVVTQDQIVILKMASTMAKESDEFPLSMLPLIEAIDNL